MRMTRILVPAAIVSWLWICGVVTQNHEALVIRELGARSSHDKLPPPQDSPTGPQASASNPTTANAEYVERLEREIKALRSEREEIRQSKCKDWEKKVHAVNNRIYVRHRNIQGAGMGVPYATRLLDRKQRSGAKRSNHRSLGELQERVKRLKEHRDSVHGPERIRSNIELSGARRRLRGEMDMDAFMKKKEAGELESGNSKGTGDWHLKEFNAELEMGIKQEQDSKMKKAAKRTQQSHEHNNGHEKAAEPEAVGALTLEASHSHAGENLDSWAGVQLGGDGSGARGKDSSYEAGCFNENFDLYVWGQECDTRDPNNGNWQDSEGRY